ncbi:MAG TPA: SoxR reducing system RseC family protein [Selenomonadales bacterium]|nr:SoxR reducing system RseC family protein [Selenomonadales bacterium]
MKKEQEGVVLAATAGMAKVKTSRHNDCENCGACPGNAAIVLDARNPIGAKPGQRVLVEVQEVGMLKSAFVVYMLPLIAMFVGAWLGTYLADQLAREAVWFQVGGAGLFLIGSVLYVKYFDKSAGSNTKMQPVITRILTE